MKDKQLFDKTVNILVNAYKNDTLKHGDYCGCAVGNLIHSNMGYCISKKENGDYLWHGADGGEWYDSLVLGYPITENTIKEINSTGYSSYELTKIEKSFERAEDKNGDRMFDGLMKVVDCLMLIHQATEVQATHAKKLFVKETV